MIRRCSALLLVLLATAAPGSAETALAAERLLGLRDDPGRHLTLTWQGTIRAEAGRPGSWIEQMLERKFNVTFRPSFVVYFSYPRVVPIRLLGGDVPDVTWIKAEDMQRFARHGFALELPWAVLQKHAPNYVRLLNAHAPEAWLLSFREGKNYGVPLFTIETRHPKPGYWRTDWLRNVGIDRIPVTLDEMEEALRRFRHHDPDGNGRMDTYGMCPWKPPVAPDTLDRSFEEIFGAHGVIPTAWMERQGKIVWGGVLPETKTTLARLRRWYAEGLIYPDYVVVPSGSIDLIKKFTGGLVGYLYGLSEYRSFDLDWKPSLAAVVAAVHPGGTVAPAAFPRGPEGWRGGRGVIFGEQLSVLMFGSHLAKEPEKVLRVLRMLDAMAADEELYLAARIGQRGVHWEWDEEKGLYALPPYDSRFHASRQLLHWVPEPWLNWGYYAPFGSSRTIADRYRTAAHREFDETHRNPKFALYDALGHASAVESAELYLSDLVQLQVTTFAEIVNGRRPLEHFDVFAEQWLARGGRVLTAEANSLYAQRDEILRRAGVQSAP